MNKQMNNLKEDIEEYFEPVDKGNWKGFTFKKYLSQYKWIFIFIFLISLGMSIHSYIEQEKTLLYGALIFQFISLVAFIAAIVDWGKTKNNMER